MTDYYSSLWDQAPFRGTTTFIARSSQVYQRGNDISAIFTFNLGTSVVLATNDIIHLLPATPSGFRLTRWCATFPGYDGGTSLTMNLGFLSQASGAGVITGLTTGSIRNGGTISATDAQLLAASASTGPVTATTNLLAPGKNDELVIFVSAGAASAGTNGLTTLLLEGSVP